MLTAIGPIPTEIEYKDRGRKTNFKLGYDQTGAINNVVIRGNAKLSDIRAMLPIPTPIITEPIDYGVRVSQSNLGLSNAAALMYTVPVGRVLHLKYFWASAHARGGAANCGLYYNEPARAGLWLVLDEMINGDDFHAITNCDIHIPAGSTIWLYSSAAAGTISAAIYGLDTQA